MDKCLNRHVLLVASLTCAALFAQVAATSVTAAVPVEESVEDVRRDVQQSQRLPGTQIGAPASTDPRSLDIPPTIEPSINTDYANPGVGVATTTQAGSASAGVSSSQLSELFYQLQVLQQEMQDLRGQVEEQTYLVNRLQREQKEQYLDLDRRLVALSQNQPPPGPSASAPPVTSTTPAAVGGNLSEREAYTQAFEAMRARDFETSLVGFKNLIERYPNGQYTANAYYWIGELYLVAQTDLELARQSFMQVVNLYPDHQKAPDALYKLGVVYHTLGDVASAKDYLGRVQRDYPNTSAAGLAAKYAAEL